MWKYSICFLSIISIVIINGIYNHVKEGNQYPYIHFWFHLTIARWIFCPVRHSLFLLFKCNLNNWKMIIIARPLIIWVQVRFNLLAIWISPFKQTHNNEGRHVFSLISRDCLRCYLLCADHKQFCISTYECSFPCLCLKGSFFRAKWQHKMVCAKQRSTTSRYWETISKELLSKTYMHEDVSAARTWK